jgi:hypothetical protein
LDIDPFHPRGAFGAIFAAGQERVYTAIRRHPAAWISWTGAPKGDTIVADNPGNAA